MSLYLNTYQLNHSAQMWNVDNTTGDPKVRINQLCDTNKIQPINWFDLWKNATGESFPSCAVTGCENRAEVGAHVTFLPAGNSPGTGSNRVFICPMCKSCNNQRGAQLSIKRYTFLIHLGLFMKDLLPDEYELTINYENSPEKKRGISMNDYVNHRTTAFIQSRKNEASGQRVLSSDDQRSLDGPFSEANQNLENYALSLSKML